ncbi:hypothetical protein RhiirB3_474549 [Rhizophagus irregularis]|nr:hypothetical protein RhiirB3_474549 [Rhizophagus irregularis]
MMVLVSDSFNKTKDWGNDDDSAWESWNDPENVEDEIKEFDLDKLFPTIGIAKKKTISIRTAIKLQLVKVKAHNDSEYNNMVDNLAKDAVSKDPIYIDPRLLMYKGNVCWNRNLIEKEVTIMIKHIRETQWIEEFFNLHRNECWNNSETLAEIEWPYTFRVLKGNMELTNFSEHELNSFKVKIRTEELPTLDNLIKRKPHVYSSKWKCPMCLKDDKTYSHL